MARGETGVIDGVLKFFFPPVFCSAGSPKMDKKKQFATVALSKNTRQRRPSTVKLFGNTANPFADTSTSTGPPHIAPQRDDSSLESRKAPADMGTSDNATFDAHQNRHAEAGGTRESELLAQYKAREPQLVKQWSAQQPFQFGNAADVALASQGFVARKEEDRMKPEDWEPKVASYNEWELGMLHKLARVAELLLTPDAALSDQHRLHERLDEIAKQDTSERAKPVAIRRPSTPQDLGSSADTIEQLSGEGTPTPSKKKSPRSPESQRKNFGSWSAKVAAAKKKSLERKKGADTLSQLKTEQGLPLPDGEMSGDSKSLFSIWNKDGTMATQQGSRSNTPSASPIVQRKSTGGPAVTSPDQVGGETPSKSGSGKKPNPNVLTDAPSPSLSTKASTPNQSRKTNRFSSIRAKRNSVRADEDEGPSVAFPGLSLRSADAASFQELLKMDKQRKETEEGPSSPTTLSGASTPSLSDSFSPIDGLVGAASSRSSLPVFGKQTSDASKVAAAFGRRTSVKSPSKIDSTPPSISPSASPGPAVGSPVVPSVALQLGANLSSSDGGTPPQKSPKSHKRFSIVFARRGESPTLSPRSSQVSEMAGGSGVSPRSAAKAVPKGKVPSPRKNDRSSTPVFGRRKTGSPRGGEDGVLSMQQQPVSPPLSARELIADASALEALDDMLKNDEET